MSYKSWTEQEECDLLTLWPNKSDIFFEKYPSRSEGSARRKFGRLVEQDIETPTDLLIESLPSHVRPVFEDIQIRQPVDIKQVMRVSRELQIIFDEQDPVTTATPISFDTDKPIGIIGSSCAHLGSRYTFYEGFEEIFYEVLEIPRLFWGSWGDDIDGFIPSFYSAEAVVGQLYPPYIQRRLLAAVLDELIKRNKLLFGTWSEHAGKWYETKIGENPIKELYLQRKVPYFDGRGLVTLQVGQQKYQLLVGHGLKGNSIYNLTHAQTRAARWDYPSADIIVNGGKHRYASNKTMLWKAEYDSGLRPSPYVHLIELGTAKTGPDKYTIRGWAKGILEWPILIFYPGEHKIRVTEDLEEAKYWLDV